MTAQSAINQNISLLLKENNKIINNKISKWATENGFKFSKTKTKCIHFCNQRKPHNNPTLPIEKENIPFVDQHKHLGLIFDKKLNFIPHINYIKTKCNKALQHLCVIAHTNWGADKNTLLKLYRSLIRSKIDYSCFIYQSARKSYLKSLNPVYHTRLRLALSAFKTTPIESLYAEANEPPPKLRCNSLALKYYTKLKADLNNSTHDSTFYPKYKDLFQKNENSIKIFGLRMEPIYKEAVLPITKIHKTTLFKTPPWKIIIPKTDYSLCKHNKKATHPIAFQKKFQKVKEKYPNYIHIFTDGSKENNATTSAVIISRKIQIKKHLPREISIFSAEVYAINLALDLITKSRNTKHIVFSDSQSAIGKKFNNQLIAELLTKLNNLCNQKKLYYAGFQVTLESREMKWQTQQQKQHRAIHSTHTSKSLLQT